MSWAHHGFSSNLCPSPSCDVYHTHNIFGHAELHYIQLGLEPCKVFIEKGRKAGEQWTISSSAVIDSESYLVKIVIFGVYIAL
jgi:hypothetical protein